MINAKDIDIQDFVYDLPDERIAKHPLSQRDACKLLVADSTGVKYDGMFSELVNLLPSDTFLVYNNTRVINARIRMHKASGALIEIFCLEPIAPSDYERNFASTDSVSWRCFVGNSKRWKEGALELLLDGGKGKLTLSATRIADGDRSWAVTFRWDNSAYTFAEVIDMAGQIPIPPYLNRDAEECDSEDYQTVFGVIDGSVAAPTAGLHFTDELLKRLEVKGVTRGEVTLHVGAGTFQPVTGDRVGEHRMHSEYIIIELDFIRKLRDRLGHVCAVGTTSVRTLESLYHIGCLIHDGNFNGELPQWYWQDKNHPHLSAVQSLDEIIDYLEVRGLKRLVASTRIIIAPGYNYQLVDCLITNFHQPGSTLLLLVSALIGEAWREVYDYALKHDYRFLSYGDACLFTRSLKKA